MACDDGIVGLGTWTNQTTTLHLHSPPALGRLRYHPAMVRRVRSWVRVWVRVGVAVKVKARVGIRVRVRDG